jgi:MATE family multidrug resistance protein
MLVEFGAFAAIGLLMGWLGTVALAGHQIALNLASLTFMVPLGVAQATAVLVGRAVGRGDPSAARRSAGAGLSAGATFMSATAVVFLTTPGLLARLYTDEPEVLAVAAALIPLAGVFQIFDGLQVVGSAVLRGVGDTRAPMVVNVLGFWLVGMPISILLGFTLGGGPVGLWWGLVGGLAAVAVFLLARVRQRFGRELRRLVLAGH